MNFCTTCSQTVKDAGDLSFDTRKIISDVSSDFDCLYCNNFTRNFSHDFTKIGETRQIYPTCSNVIPYTNYKFDHTWPKSNEILEQDFDQLACSDRFMNSDLKEQNADETCKTRSCIKK